ncbi:MAG TPA: hypothetical protein VK589_22035 [Chryseolinea sp.]|nr:hypothetical protein [Chryseolinea sp.]
MVKQYVLYITAITLAIIVSACTTKRENQHETEVVDADEWPQMDEFHMIMAESFHPFRDSADIGPAKANADSLVASADKWLNSQIPSKVNNEEVKEMLQNLKTEAEAFAILSKTDDPKAIGESLTKLHDHFHQLQEVWYGGGEQHEHH